MKNTPVIDEARRARAAESSPSRRPASPSSAAVTKTGNQSHPTEESRKTFLLRISPDLWKEVEGWAQAELRSVNGQIEYLLRQAVSQRRRK